MNSIISIFDIFTYLQNNKNNQNINSDAFIDYINKDNKLFLLPINIKKRLYEFINKILSLKNTMIFIYPIIHDIYNIKITIRRNITDEFSYDAEEDILSLLCHYDYTDLFTVIINLGLDINNNRSLCEYLYNDKMLSNNYYVVRLEAIDKIKHHIQLYLSHGADIYLRDNNNLSALDYIIRLDQKYGHNLEQYMLDYIKSINQ